MISWNSLDPNEKRLITFGVPLVALAALYTIVKGKKAPAPAATSTTVMTGPPQFGSTSSESFDLYHQLTAYLTDLQGNGITLTPSNPGSGKPPMPITGPNGGIVPHGPVPVDLSPSAAPSCAMNGLDGHPNLCNDDQLVAGCIDSHGNPSIIAELFRRGHSVNDPRFGGPNHPNDCGRNYVLYALGHGAVPA